jgi:hypothetical protein
MTFNAFYKRYFKKEASSKSSLKSLKFGDLFMTPSDRFGILEPLFIPRNRKVPYGIITLVGYVISEKVAFYAQLRQALKSQKLFSLKESDLVFES